MREVDTVAAAEEWLELPTPRPPAAFQQLDLRDLAGFESGWFGGCLFLSCRLTPAQAGYLTTVGATVVRDDPARPYSAHRARLYTPDELFAGFDRDAPDGWSRTYDAQVYRHWVDTGRTRPDRIDESLARRLHDHSISDALHDELDGTMPVAIMGGHGLERRAARYAEIARMARTLARDGFLPVSGGGPGAMEAAHLGVWMAHFDDAALDDALAMLAPRPAGAPAGREYADPDWLHRAMAVCERWPLPDPVEYHSIGIPTWMYGHEPPAPFATMIAKYFANGVREEGLLAVATSGAIFAPGSAGTVQEIFQDACQNHYASFGPPAPMVLLGVAHWNDRLPAWPLLLALSGRRPYRSLLELTDHPEVAIEHIRSFRDHPPTTTTTT